MPGHASVLLAAAALAWPGCAPRPLLRPLDAPDAGASNPCVGGPGRVSILTPEERRIMCPIYLEPEP